jgi:hypothetical protein
MSIKPRISLVLVLLVCSSCTHYINAPAEPYAEYPAETKKPITVGLIQTEALKNAEWTHPGFKMPLGANLTMNTALLTQRMFQNAVIADSKGDLGQEVDVVLIPTLLYANRTLGASSFGESIVTVQLGWRATDSSGEPLWIETITGEASGSTGWTDPDDLLAEALEQLWRGSWQALASAEYR